VQECHKWTGIMTLGCIKREIIGVSETGTERNLAHWQTRWLDMKFKF
jgi:hypothetical protein